MVGDILLPLRGQRENICLTWKGRQENQWFIQGTVARNYQATSKNHLCSFLAPLTHGHVVWYTSGERQLYKSDHINLCLLKCSKSPCCQPVNVAPIAFVILSSSLCASNFPGLRLAKDFHSLALSPRLALLSYALSCPIMTQAKGSPLSHPREKYAYAIQDDDIVPHLLPRC